MSDIAILGFGEAAQAFTVGWRSLSDGDVAIATYDVKVADEDADLSAACECLNVVRARDPAAALAGRSLVFSLVTADRAHEAAESAARVIRPGSLYLDCNSCAPKTKRASAALIEAAGARYIDVAVMAPVYPDLHRTPLLLAGEAAPAAMARLAALGMKARIAGPRVGEASSIKMIRSIMIKGLEALTAECILAARRAGVTEAVLASLQASDPGFDWRGRSAYNLERMMVHGARRASEMREVAATLRDLGLPDRMTRAAAAWQDQMAAPGDDVGDTTLDGRADRALARIER